MQAIASITKYTLKQHLRSRIYLVAFLFGVLLLMAGLVFSSLAVEQRQRVTVDFGFAAIEMLALLFVLFSSVNLILEEIETKTVALVLSHPIQRWEYIIGRFLGLTLSTAVIIAIMGIAHILLLSLVGVHWQNKYIVSLFFSFIKVLLAGGIGIFFSVFSSSGVVAFTFTVVFWIMGHFSSELRFLAYRTGNIALKHFSLLIYYILPKLDKFSYRDLIWVPHAPHLEWFLWIVVYTCIYIFGCLFLTHLLFTWKEF